jgi:hypothetical protein
MVDFTTGRYIADFSKRTALELAEKAKDVGHYELWMAWDIAYLATWLLTGESDPYLQEQRIRSYETAVTRGGHGDPEISVEQAIRLLESGQRQEATALLAAIPHIHRSVSRQEKKSAAIVAEAAAILSGKLPAPGWQAQFRAHIKKLRQDCFPRGSYADMVPWVRLYNLLFVRESDPWIVLSWLLGDPMQTLPT